MLDDIAGMYGLLMEYQVATPASVLVAVMGDSSHFGFYGENGAGGALDENSIFRIGSISKAMAGQVMAGMIADGKVAAEAPVTEYLPDLPGTVFPDGTPMRMIDLVGQAAGLPRDLPVDPGPDDNPDQMQTLPAISAYLEDTPLFFAPGTRLLYSNFGYQLLGAALGAANDSSYGAALEQYLTGPLGMEDTAIGVPEDKLGRLLPGYLFDDSEFPLMQPGDLLGASGGIFTTAKDMERWMRWNLSQEPDPVRDIFHAPHADRSDFRSVSMMDESGHLDEMGMGWVIMHETEAQPYTLQKAGAHGGYMAYLALAPEKQAAVFMMINKYDFDADETMTALANSMLAALPGAMD
ncbi:serine hydrolase [Poseidonocella sp. HB161398]|uniref:serine hydrolase n=1 Tax=Poseidonocella sp. HB161398 TaxID=2320855 RepID=UPI001485EFBF|nr:serine hydrolase [Poseidonocella sp. HB161398]